MSTSSYELYGDAGSGSATTELALAYIGVPVRLHERLLARNAQRAADYASVNPQRKLPTLVTPEGEILTESAAILLTLADRHPEAELLPADPVVRARALRWLLFMACELYPVIEIIDYPERFQPEADATPADRRERLREHARGIWRRRFSLVEDAAAGTPWFLDGGFSLLDPYAAVLSRWAQVDDWRADNLPRIDGIARSIAEHERLASTWRRHFPD